MVLVLTRQSNRTRGSVGGSLGMGKVKDSLWGNLNCLDGILWWRKRFWCQKGVLVFVRRAFCGGRSHRRRSKPLR